MISILLYLKELINEEVVMSRLKHFFCRKKLSLLVSPLIVLLLLFVIFIINDVYPFGQNTIINGDFGKAYLPVYYYMYDFFQGKVSIFMNYKIGLGSDMYDLISVYGILSPLSWLLILTSRSNIPYFLSYLLIIKLCLMSITSFFLFDKIYKKVHFSWKVFFSVLYALSSWVIVYHTNFVWLDNVILFPILLYVLKKISDNGDYKLYVFILFLSTIYSFYITYMELLFVLFLSFGYVHFLCDKKEGNKFLLNLSLGTILALGLSFGFVFPTLCNVLNSSRFSSSFSLKDIVFCDITDKLFIVCFYAFPIILFFIMLKSKLTNKKIRNLFIYLFAIMFSGILFNQINSMWHTGSYNMFPYRYGFISIMVLYLGVLYYLEFNSKLQFSIEKNNYFYIVFVFLLLLFVYFKYIPISAASNPSVGLRSLELIFYILLILVLSLLLVINVLLLKNLFLKKYILLFFSFFSCIALSLGYVGIHSPKLTNENTDYSAKTSNDLYSFLKQENQFFRYRDFSSSLVSNYGFMVDKPVISDWHLTNKNTITSLKKLGYNGDSGGTLFTDNLLGIHWYLSREKINNPNYAFVSNNKLYNLYELKNSLLFSIPYYSFDEKNYSNDVVGYQNQIYQNLFHQKGRITENIEVNGKIKNNICTDSNRTFTFDINVSELSELYLNVSSIDYTGTDQFFIGNDSVILHSISVNDNLLYNPNVNEENNYHFNSSSIKDLGIFEKGNVKVSISLYKDTCIKNLNFFKININQFNEFISNYKKEDIVDHVEVDKNKLSLRVNTKDKDRLFLPINYVDNYVCYVNDKKVKLDKVFNYFISIPLVSGENDISLLYYPPYIKVSLVVSFIFLVLFFVLEKFKKILNFILVKIFPPLYYIVFVLMFFYIYIYGFIR